MIILGIDPGLASTGVGVIEERDGDSYRCINSAYVTTTNKSPLPQRLKKIHDLIEHTIGLYEPEVVAVESVFFAKNVRSAVMMAHGRGAALLAAARAGVEIREYSPLEIKQSVVGKGRATKTQVQQMISILLALRQPPRSDHESDALACALCHAFRAQAASRRIIAAHVTGEEIKRNAADGIAARKELLARGAKYRRRRRRR